MKFSELPYERIDRDALIARLTAFTEALQAAKTFHEAEAVFLDFEKAADHADTMFTVPISATTSTLRTSSTTPRWPTRTRSCP